MDSVTIKKNQSIFDIAIQLYGDAASAVRIAIDNNLSLDEEVKAGTIIIFEAQKTFVPTYFRVTNTTVSNWIELINYTIELRDDDGLELRDDGGKELRDA